MSDRSTPTPPPRRSRGLSGRPVEGYPPAGAVPGQPPLTFVPLDPATLEHLPATAAINHPIEVDDRPDDRTIARAITAYDRRRGLAAYAKAAMDREVDAAVDAHDVIEVPVEVGDVTVIHLGRIPRQRGRYLAAILATMTGAAVLGVGVVAPVPAQAATVHAMGTATEGPGINVPGHHLGAYELGSHELYCINFGKMTGDGPTHTGTADARVAYIVDKWGNTSNAVQSADTYLAANSLVGNAAFDAALPGFESHLSDRGARVRAMVAEATRLAGPWHIAVTAPKTAPGTMAVATITVTSASGNPVPGVQVVTHGIGALVSTATLTNGAGVAQAEVRPSVLSYTITASVQAPGTTVWTNSPSAGHQILVGAGPNVTVNGSACASVCPVSATVTESAACTDQGAHQLTVTYTADATPGSYRATLSVNGVPATSALAPESTVTLQVQVHAGDVVSVSWQALDNGGNVLINRTLTSLTVQS